MFTPTSPVARPAASPFARLSTGSSLRQSAGRRRLTRLALVLAAVVVALVVLWVLFRVFVGLVTTAWWFDSVHAGSVYSTMLKARIGLFVVFAIIGGAAGAATLLGVRRIRPLHLSADYDTFRWIFRRYESKAAWLLIALAAIVPGVLVGRAAAAGWQTYLLWANSRPWHTSDPYFHKDVSFFVQVLPFQQMVVGLLLKTVLYGLVIAVGAGYWYGAWRIRRGKKKVAKGMIRVVSALGAAYLALQAVNLWLSRYSFTLSPRGPVTGVGYTDRLAGIPSKYVLLVIALLVAAGLVVNATRHGRVRWLATAVVVMLAAQAVIGSAWPALLNHFREAPSAATLDLDEIRNNQRATMAAFGLDGVVRTVPYDTSKPADEATVTKLADEVAQVSLLDPNQLSPTFNVEQQLQAYYGFKSTLDISHYPIGGKSQDVALAVRELKPGGIPHPTWVTTHLVYTHGYGVVAAPTTEVDPDTSTPVFLNGGMPPAQDIPVTRPQVYFGQHFGANSYAIVGRPEGSTQDLEFDHPGSNGAPAAHTTYTGDGGIPIGSAWRRLLFAIQLHTPNIFFSSELNSASRLLEIRDPAARVAHVAPWLTLDGDVYPAIVDGQIKWIVDGYTTSANYPDSQLINLGSSVRTTLVADGSSTGQANTQVNYLRNSVKAVVDAYTGQVSLYEWDQSKHVDPLLKTWEAVFPGLVQPQSAIPANLVDQLRYPTDLFNVQRSLLARYHVSSASNFYSGNDFWTVPTDPTVGSSNSVNGATSGSSSARTAPLPSRYASQSVDGFGRQQYTLSTPMVTLNGQQLASFISVNAQPGPDYGTFTVLRFPSGSVGGLSPAQVQNSIESNTKITEALTLQRGGNSKVVLGDLEAIPLAGRLLYVEPVYTQSSGGSSYPILRHVIALYGDGTPSFEDTLPAAISAAVHAASGTH
ncbi:MAG: UPF0182 family protein [Jatrophihabitans sp.]|uniref:UPF0182 family protein n=1 Tax=Jatrophihabitans sp. TaxID=1932789 RepID=UPI003F7EFB31